MPWMTKAGRMILLQRISLLLNLLFFAHLLLLYYGGLFLNERSNGNEIQNLGENQVQLPAAKDFGAKNHVRVIFTAGQNTDPTAADQSISGDRKVMEKSDKKKSPVQDLQQGKTGSSTRELSLTLPAKTSDQVPQLSIIYLITPTTDRPTRKADFTRLAQTIRQVPNLHWIVVEDGDELSDSVANILKRLVINYTYLMAPTPNYKLLGFDRDLNKGIFQRNVAIEWLRWKHKDLPLNTTQPGVVYFADDDNTYDLRLFEMMRRVTLVSVWPVALVGGVKLEKPVKDTKTGQLSGFEVGFAPNRTFAIDMAGFATSLDLLLRNRRGHFPLDTVQGWNEPALLDSLDLSYEDIQVLGLDIRTPSGLLEPLVWHTKTTAANLVEEDRFKTNYGHISDEGWEV